jgi:hypothetical protein
VTRFLAVPVIAISLVGAAPMPFREHTIATGLKGGYQVVPFDVNHDGRIDLIAVASGMTDLVWYENPGPNKDTWERHVIASDLPRMINVAAADLNGSGIPTIALAYEFSMDASKSIGRLVILTSDGDPRRPWKMTEIDRLPTSHRLRWADIDGSGKRVLVNAPLTGSRASPPEFVGRVPLVFYRPGEWKRQLIDDLNEGVVHGISIVDWDGDGRDEILTASFLGIHLHKYKPGGDQQWSRTEITKGDPAAWPKSGTSDIAVGKTGRERFVAAIEPWHGNQVSIYRKSGSAWARQVVDDTLLDGHTIQAADLDGDGSDEIIAGCRGKPQSVYIYKFDGAAGWHRQTLDDGRMAAGACAVADLSGHGRTDVACIGSATQNLKVYENLSND